MFFKNVLSPYSEAAKVSTKWDVLIKKGDTKDTDYVLQDGEMAFNKIDKEFYVGDGKTPIRELSSFNNLVEGDNGIVYLVRIDENGNPEAKEAKMFFKDREYSIKTRD